MATIQGIYIALFGRPADPLGLAYFNEVTNDGADLTAIGDLAGTAEYQDRFEGMSNAQIVTAIYQSLFGRAPELAGLEYFVNELNSGRQTINTVAINILDGAQGADAEIVANKEAAANLFTAAVAADADALANYQGAYGVAAGVSFLSGITADEATIPDEAAVDAAVAALADGRTDGPTFTLTTAVDNFEGTGGDDVFNAITGGNVDSRTLNSFDAVDGGAGVDTMNIISRGSADVQVPLGASVQNVEIINVLNQNNNDVAAAGFVGAEQIWQIGGAGNISGLAAGTTAGFRNTDANAGATPIVVAAAAGATSVSIALDEAGAAATAGDDGEVALSITGAKVQTVTISGTVADDGKLSLINLPVGLETLNLALDSDSDIAAYTGPGTGPATAVLQTVTTIDASASTGDLTVGLAGLPTLDAETILLGSGNDEVVIATPQFDAEEVTIDLGAGNDTLVIWLGQNEDLDLSVGTGAGDDVIMLLGGNIAVNVDDDGFDGSVTITDFNAASDSLLVAGFNGFTAQNLVNTAIADADSLYDAVEALEALLDNSGVNITSFAKFTYEGDTYLYGNYVAGLDGDLLVGFTGVVDLNNDNVAVL